MDIRYQNVMKFSKQLWQSYSPFIDKEHIMNIVHHVIHMHVHVPVFVHFRYRSKDIQLINQIKLLLFFCVSGWWQWFGRFYVK